MKALKASNRNSNPVVSLHSLVFFDKIKSLLPETVSLDVRHLTESYSVRQPQQDLGDARQFAGSSERSVFES